MPDLFYEINRTVLPNKIDHLVKELLTGNRRALARAITMVESDDPEAINVVKKTFVHSGHSHIIGVTGSPGVGKSTLIDQMISVIRSQNLTVGVLTIDPSSPFSGGAILGDRLRMQKHTLDQGVFIRSMANRGYHGGIAAAAYDTIRLFEAGGFDVVIIETVGAGQSEVSVTQIADTIVVVLMPGSGDDIQVIKSGIMEIGDIFVVSKSDLSGADQTAAYILNNLEITSHGQETWQAPVILSNVNTMFGSEEIWQAILKHKTYLKTSGLLLIRKRNKVLNELREITISKTHITFLESMEKSETIDKLVDKILKGSLDPHSAAKQLLKYLFIDQE